MMTRFPLFIEVEALLIHSKRPAQVKKKEKVSFNEVVKVIQHVES